MNVKTGKADLILSYIVTILRTASNFFLLPVVLRMLSDSEYGLWNIYISMSALISLLSLGFTDIVRRYMTYAFCGAEKIESDVIPKVEKGTGSNFKLLNIILDASMKIYKRISIAAVCCMLLLGGYLLYVNSGELNPLYIISSWYIYGLGKCIELYFSPFNSAMKAMGKIKENSIYQIIQQVAYILITVFFILLHLGLLAISIAQIVSVLVYRILISNVVKNDIKSNQFKCERKTESWKEELLGIKKIVNRSTGELFLATIGSYIVSYGSTVVCSTFLPLDAIGSLGLSNQVVGLLSTAAATPFDVFMSQMGEHKINRQFKKARKKYASVTWFQFSAMLAGGLVIILAGDMVLNFLGSNTVLLSKTALAIMIITALVTSNHQRCTNFLMLSNRQDHAKAYFASSIVTVVMSVAVVGYTHSIYAYLLISMLVQLSYNAWKWPLEVRKELNK